MSITLTEKEQRTLTNLWTNLKLQQIIIQQILHFGAVFNQLNISGGNILKTCRWQPVSSECRYIWKQIQEALLSIILKTFYPSTPNTYNVDIHSVSFKISFFNLYSFTLKLAFCYMVSFQTAIHPIQEQKDKTPFYGRKASAGSK